MAPPDPRPPALPALLRELRAEGERSAIMRGTTRAVPVSKELNMLKVRCGRCGETD